MLPQAALSVGAAARVLDATNNQITQIAEGIKQLTSLQRLILAANQLQSLPPAICQSSSLKVKAVLYCIVSRLSQSCYIACKEV